MKTNREKIEQKRKTAGRTSHTHTAHSQDKTHEILNETKQIIVIIAKLQMKMT